MTRNTSDAASPSASSVAPRRMVRMGGRVPPRMMWSESWRSSAVSTLLTSAGESSSQEPDTHIRVKATLVSLAEQRS